MNLSDIFPLGVTNESTGNGMFSSSSLLGDLSGGYVGLPGSTGTNGTTTAATSSVAGMFGSAMDILGGLSSIGTVVNDPTSVNSSIGVTQGTSNANTYENPGGTVANNPASPITSGSGSTLLDTLNKYKYNIFAVVLGVIFIIIGAAQMAKSITP